MLILFVLGFEGGKVTLSSGKIKAQRIRLRQYNTVNYRSLYEDLRHLSHRHKVRHPTIINSMVDINNSLLLYSSGNHTERFIQLHSR